MAATPTLIYYTQHLFWNRVVYSIYFSMLSLQLCIAFWRYEITLRSSFLFSLFGTGLLLIGGWVNLWVSGVGTCLVQILYYCGNYFLTHGALHQSNLQFEIDKLQDNMRRSYWFNGPLLIEYFYYRLYIIIFKNYSTHSLYFPPGYHSL